MVDIGVEFEGQNFTALGLELEIILLSVPLIKTGTSLKSDKGFRPAATTANVPKTVREDSPTVVWYGMPGPQQGCHLSMDLPK